MKDLQLTGGDLVPSGRGFATVTGAAYIRQRVATALGEPYGDDQYNPTWGSTLPAFLGAPIAAGTPGLISAEASRVLQVLMAAQQQMVTSSTLTGTRSQLAQADVIASVDSVSAAVTGQPATINIAIALTTMAGQQLQISRAVSSSG